MPRVPTTIYTILTLTLLATACAAKDSRPNILFIFSDDHAYQAIGCYGSRVNQTPNLDRIAKEGMRFDRCFVTNSICGPSRAVILTGKYSHLNGFVRNGNTFNGKQQNVAKLLGQAGYQTALVGKWHLKSEPTGFNYYHRLIGQGPYYNPTMRTNAGDVGPRGFRDVKHTGYTTEIITDLALDWLEQKRDDDKPFLLMYQHKAPHRNWQPGPKQLTHYDDVTIPEPETLYDDYEGRTSAAKNQEMTIVKHMNPNDLKLVPQAGLTPEQRAAWDQAYGPKNKAFEAAKLEGKALLQWKFQRYAKDYLRCIDSVDENVGRVLDYLDDSGLADNTIVIYSSDQGWYLGEHGWYDKRWMYEESFRTPLMVRWPAKIKSGGVSDAMVMNLDFPELFLDVAGAEIPADMQGRSILPILEGKQPADWRQSVYYHYYEFPGAHSVAKHYGVRTNRHKLIHFYELDEWELFDLETDPHELKSVFEDPDYADVLADMRKELTRLREQYGDDGSVVDFDSARAGEVKLRQVLKLDFEDGKIPPGVTSIDGPSGTAIQLTGTGAVATRASSDELNPAYKPIAIGAWCRPDEPDGVLIAQGGESQGYSLYLQNKMLVFAIRAAGILKQVRGGRVPIDQWSHVAALLDADGQAHLYVNGKPVGKRRKLGFVTSRPADGLTVGHDGGSLVGDYESTLPFTGGLDDARIYWGPLPIEELRAWAK